MQQQPRSFLFLTSYPSAQHFLFLLPRCADIPRRKVVHRSKPRKAPQWNMEYNLLKKQTTLVQVTKNNRDAEGWLMLFRLVANDIKNVFICCWPKSFPSIWQ